MSALRRCVVHIGHAKTATTYLQHCLHLNEALFRAHGYAVPGDFSSFGFQDLVQLARAGIVISGNLAPLHEVMARQDAALRAAMEAYLFAVPDGMAAGSGLILSSELFFYYPFATASVVGAARARGLEPEIVAYVARQDRAAIAGYLQNVRLHGFDGGVADFLLHDPRMGYMQYLRAMGRLQDATGVKITLRSFDRRFLAGGDVFADFLELLDCGIVSADCVLPDVVSNEGLLLEQYELLRVAALLHRPDAAQRLAAGGMALSNAERARVNAYYYRPHVRDYLLQHIMPDNPALLARFMPGASDAEIGFWGQIAAVDADVALDDRLMERLRCPAFA